MMDDSHPATLSLIEGQLRDKVLFSQTLAKTIFDMVQWITDGP